VLDLYPLVPPDPLLAFLEKTGAKRSTDTGAASDAPSAVAETNGPSTVREKPARGGPGKGEPRSKRLIIIAIDAGHGGEDPGARGHGGTYEKNVTLAIARRLKARIDQETNMRAVLIRDGDYYIPLHMRVQKARRINADLFVSVHADAFIKPHARGSSVFTLSESGATSVAANWLAKRENEADLIGGVNLDVQDPYLKRTLLDLSQTATINDSLKLAKSVLAELGEINTLHKPHVEQAGFAVLRSPDIPSILVETAFISNPQEERRLRDPAYQNKMADAILAGIKRYFAKNPPLARDRLAQTP
jgi:N-acetylmuramoyl-L-alanine amidase